jgi:aspartate aminotransferase-like enzyme
VADRRLLQLLAEGLGAPSGLAPICFSPRALESGVPSRSFYLDVRLLHDY